MPLFRHWEASFNDWLKKNTQHIRYPYICAILFACIAYLYLTIKFFIDADVSYPVFDNWGYFADLIDHADNNNLSALLVKQANEHRPVLTFIAMLVDYTYFGFNLKFIKIFHLLSYGALVTFIIWLSGQITNELDRSIRNSAKLLVSVSGLFFMLSMRQWEIHYGYTNVGTIQGFLFFACSIYLYNKRFDWRASGNKVTYASFVVVAIFALLSAASMAFGLLTIPFVFAISVLRGAPKKESWLLILLTFTFYFVYGIGMNLAPSDGAEWKLYPNDLIRIMYFSAMLLGSLFIAKKIIAVLIGIIGIAITTIASIVLFKRRTHHSELVTVYSLLMLSIAYAIMVGIGRRHMSDESAMVSRYMLAAVIYWQSLFTVSVYAGLQFFPQVKHQMLSFFKFALIPIVIVLFIHQKFKHEFIVDTVRKNSLAVNALQFGIVDSFLSNQVISMDQLYSWVKVLYDHKTSIYGMKLANQYGQIIHETYGNNSRCTGGISSIDNRPIINQLASDSSTMGLKLSGWAWNKPSALVHPSSIILVDQHGVIKGAGLFSVKRPDVTRNLGDPTAKDAEWVAFARLDQDATEIYGYAIYDKENEACLFDTYKIQKSHFQEGFQK